MKWHKVIAVLATANKWDQMLHFPITAPWQQVLLEKQRRGHLAAENLPALNQNDVHLFGQWQNSGGRFSTSTPAR